MIPDPECFPKTGHDTEAPLESKAADPGPAQTPEEAARGFAEAFGKVVLSGTFPSSMLFANIPALPERCPRCKRVHVRRDGCASTPRPGLVEMFTPIRADEDAAHVRRLVALEEAMMLAPSAGDDGT